MDSPAANSSTSESNVPPSVAAPEEAQAPPPPPPRLIESIYPYVWPFVVFWFFSMVQWSDDEQPASEVSTAQPTPSPQEATSLLSSATDTVHQQSFSIFTSFMGNLMGDNGSSSTAASSGGMTENGILAQAGLLGDFVLIIIIVFAIGLWRASTKVEGQPLPTDEEEKSKPESNTEGQDTKTEEQADEGVKQKEEADVKEGRSNENESEEISCPKDTAAE